MRKLRISTIILLTLSAASAACGQRVDKIDVTGMDCDHLQTAYEISTSQLGSVSEFKTRALEIAIKAHAQGDKENLVRALQFVQDQDIDLIAVERNMQRVATQQHRLGCQ